MRHLDFQNGIYRSFALSNSLNTHKFIKYIYTKIKIQHYIVNVFS